MIWLVSKFFLFFYINIINVPSQLIVGLAATTLILRSSAFLIILICFSSNSLSYFTYHTVYFLTLFTVLRHCSNLGKYCIYSSILFFNNVQCSLPSNFAFKHPPIQIGRYLHLRQLSSSNTVFSIY